MWRGALSARLPLVPTTPMTRLPFSFVLGGKNSAVLLPHWDCAATDTAMSDGRRVLSLRWTSPTLFAVSVAVTLWPNAAAVDSLLRFHNHNATHVSPLLSDACALDATWVLPADSTLETALGSDSSPRDFANVSYALLAGSSHPFRPGDYWDGTHADGTNRYAGAGRSSNGQMPFWAIESEQRGAGLFIGLGWSGQWSANFSSRSAPAAITQSGAAMVEVRGTASLEGARFVLLPEEGVRSLRVLVTSYARTELAGAGYGAEVLPWAPEFGGRKWALRVRDWPSQNGVIGFG